MRQLKVLARVKLSKSDEPSAWGWLGAPTPGYLEPEALGPIPISEIEWIEFDMTRRVHKGRLVPDAKIDVPVEVIESLKGFHFSVDLESNIVRVFPGEV
jgi:hypothetical protein